MNINYKNHTDLMAYNGLKVGNNKRLLTEIEKNSQTAADFVRYIMALQKQSGPEVAKNTGISEKHFYVLLNTLSKGKAVGNKLCANLADALNIDPYVLCRVINTRSLKFYLEQNNKQ